MKKCTCRRGPGSCLLWSSDEGCTATETIEDLNKSLLHIVSTLLSSEVNKLETDYGTKVNNKVLDLFVAIKRIARTIIEEENKKREKDSKNE